MRWIECQADVFLGGGQITPAYLSSICERLVAFKKNNDQRQKVRWCLMS